MRTRVEMREPRPANTPLAHRNADALCASLAQDGGVHGKSGKDGGVHGKAGNVRESQPEQSVKVKRLKGSHDGAASSRRTAVVVGPVDAAKVRAVLTTITAAIAAITTITAAIATAMPTPRPDSATAMPTTTCATMPTSATDAVESFSFGYTQPELPKPVARRISLHARLRAATLRDGEARCRARPRTPVLA